ncbi:ATP-dependent nuclease [Arthrobacter castelli]|uniref:ATP-dependent nuclease n=1 Tax=Arthrobacter castelli TaxID=271431 RepID=UPI001B7F7B6E|nr:AAA family ATPase [Arthrobacter castelli]
MGQLSIANFRGIFSSCIGFTGTTTLLGDNNSGKSTIFEALELVLGSDRLYRKPVIDEHDFYGGHYLDDERTSTSIRIEAVIVGLDDELRSRFRNNLEYWDTAKREVLEHESLDTSENIEPCVRIVFIGRYDVNEDDFVGQTWFASPQDEEDLPAQPCYPADKREFGFLHLRALRTGTRAMSMERGSLLDVVLRTFEVEIQMWENLLNQLRNTSVAGDDDDDFGRVLRSIDEAMKKIVAAEWAEAPHLRVSELTREDLRHVLKAFMATGAGTHSAPFNHQGSGTVNSLVIAMLTLIAERRDKRVIFAMEEPEISIPPTAQKRVVDLVRNLAGQALFTSHSPYVIEEFEPSELLVVHRDHSSGQLSGRTVDLGRSLKPKAFREGMRTRFCEALLARRVLITEGKSEALAYPFLSKLVANEMPTQFGRLDTAGWGVFDAQGDQNVAGFASFFKNLGKQVATIFDAQNAETTARIQASSDVAIEQPHVGFEDLLIAEIPKSAQRSFVDQLIDDGEWPPHMDRPTPTEDGSYDRALKQLLSKSKGETFVIQLFEHIQYSDYPLTMVNALTSLRNFTVSDGPTHDEAAHDDSLI